MRKRHRADGAKKIPYNLGELNESIFEDWVRNQGISNAERERSLLDGEQRSSKAI